eukprot:gb/GEZJ01006996.1/.p1 GENE.gb/GEZJ01006996.1/~~gb/GEZJ01006996.1/.p1  ORF type:complete len:103 (+),score=4.13 gb/GEZJ01006996.1/:224-532(+)
MYQPRNSSRDEDQDEMGTYQTWRLDGRMRSISPFWYETMYLDQDRSLRSKWFICKKSARPSYSYRIKRNAIQIIARSQKKAPWNARGRPLQRNVSKPTRRLR